MKSMTGDGISLRGIGRGVKQRTVDDTRSHYHNFKDVYHEKGLLPALWYELTTSLKSIGYRIESHDPWQDFPTPDGSNPTAKRRELYKPKKGGLEREASGGASSVASATAAIIGIIAGIFFLSGNLTGNVIGSLNQTSSNWIGGALFIIGLAGAVMFFRRK